MSPKKQTRTAAKTTKGFTDVERAAMKDRARELRAGKEDGESEVLAKIAEMKEPDRTMARRLHEMIKATVPSLAPRVWYGMPAYSRDDKVVCFFQSGQKFKTRYATLGFRDNARLDDGALWPTAYAVKELTADVETRIADLLRKAVSDERFQS